MHSHPEGDLSAYADLGLAPEQEAGLTAHLAGCDRCRRRVEELRAVRRLLAAAPAPRPSRSLLPRLSRAPAWLRPARSLASIGAGTFLFLFLASAVLQSGSGLGGGTTAAERAAARGQLAATAASSAPRVDDAKVTDASAKVAPAAAPSASAFSPAGPEHLQVTVGRPFGGPPPWLFALLAALCAAVAFGIHRRLRRS